MPFSDRELLEGVCARDPRMLARAITLVENRTRRGERLRSAFFKRGGCAHVVGVTGAPGAGKSTMVDQLAMRLSKGGKRVGIVAVDPSSPFTGGAVLGDRIRMSHAELRENVFIRSLASRGALGGLSKATSDVVQVLDAAGFDIIFVETVGVGQAEVDVVRLAHTCIVVVVPGMGDIVQAFKAGILEIADIYVVNKADRDGADHLDRDIRTLLTLGEYGEDDWRPRVVRTVATRGDGFDELLLEFEGHRNWLSNSPRANQRRHKIMQDTIIQFVGEIASERARAESRTLERITRRCVARTLEPLAAAKNLLSKVARK